MKHARLPVRGRNDPLFPPSRVQGKRLPLNTVPRSLPSDLFGLGLYRKCLEYGRPPPLSNQYDAIGRINERSFQIRVYIIGNAYIVDFPSRSVYPRRHSLIRCQVTRTGKPAHLTDLMGDHRAENLSNTRNRFSNRKFGHSLPVSRIRFSSLLSFS